MHRGWKCSAANTLQISNVNHPAVRRILRLAHRSERDRSNTFLAEGIRFVAEAVSCNAEIETIVVCSALLVNQLGHRLLAKQRARGTPILEVTLPVWERISLTGCRQGIAAVVKQRWIPISRISTRCAPVWLAVEQINSPGNFGTLIRTCEAVGASGAILLGSTLDPHEPAAVRATMGALFNVDLVRARHCEFAAWKRSGGFTAVGTSPNAKRDFRDVSYCKPTVILLGSEQTGMTKEQEALCDEVVRIPMVGRSDSLNVGVAASILLYQVFSHRHPPVGLRVEGPPSKLSTLGSRF